LPILQQISLPKSFAWALRFVEQVNYMFCTSAAKSNPLKIGYFDQTPKWNTQEIASKKGNPVARANQTLTAIYA
jgi:hypothetical protein